LAAPIRVHRFALRRDSGGPGEFRGGLGVYREYQVLEGEITLTHRGERHFCAARGCQGGLEGARSYSVIRRASGTEEVIPSKIVTELRENDRLIIETAGGGGYGDPSRRPRQRVLADVRDGKISEETAAEVYEYDLRSPATSE
jgi:N-methylhydantoinase B